MGDPLQQGLKPHGVPLPREPSRVAMGDPLQQGLKHDGIGQVELYLGGRDG